MEARRRQWHVPASEVNDDPRARCSHIPRLEWLCVGCRSLCHLAEEAAPPSVGSRQPCSEPLAC